MKTSPNASARATPRLPPFGRETTRCIANAPRSYPSAPTHRRPADANFTHSPNYGSRRRETGQESAPQVFGVTVRCGEESRVWQTTASGPAVWALQFGCDQKEKKKTGESFPVLDVCTLRRRCTPSSEVGRHVTRRASPASRSGPVEVIYAVRVARALQLLLQLSHR